jgi:hypothetical protein
VCIAGAILFPLVILVKSYRPRRSTTFLPGYLIVQILADSCILRTGQRKHHTLTLIGASWAIIFTQLAFLVSESASCQAGLTNSADVFDCSTIWWLNRLFWKGRDTVLSQSDLLPLDNKLESDRLQDRVVLVWDESMVSCFSV